MGSLLPDCHFGRRLIQMVHERANTRVIQHPEFGQQLVRSDALFFWYDRELLADQHRLPGQCACSRTRRVQVLGAACVRIVALHSGVRFNLATEVLEQL